MSRFDERDEPTTSVEADMAGPWSVEPIAGHGFGLFRASENLTRGYAPFAVFSDRLLALLAAAILPGLGRIFPVAGLYLLEVCDGCHESPCPL